MKLCQNLEGMIPPVSIYIPVVLLLEMASKCKLLRVLVNSKWIDCIQTLHLQHIL